MNRVFPSDMTAQIRGMRFTKDKLSAVFDVPDQYIDLVRKQIDAIVGFKWLAICQELPALHEEERFDNRGSSGGFGRGDSSFGRGGFGRGGRGGGPSGRGGFGRGGHGDHFGGNNAGFGMKRKREF